MAEPNDTGILCPNCQCASLSARGDYRTCPWCKYNEPHDGDQETDDDGLTGDQIRELVGR